MSINECGNIEKHETFKSFNDSKRLLDRSQFFKMFAGKKVSVMFPKSWKKPFDCEVVISAKMRLCNEWNGKFLCDRCTIQLNEVKEIKIIIKLREGQPANQFGHMLP